MISPRGVTGAMGPDGRAFRFSSDFSYRDLQFIVLV